MAVLLRGGGQGGSPLGGSQGYTEKQGGGTTELKGREVKVYCPLMPGPGFQTFT
ncbi:hypothetical protein ASNO1_01860 [Corallococcus caeni]|uniref:Uncharacterized protein n=1 Tax=Corallococcus caeni TaxID=3082388 RepID=A0ABQ6QIQ2_9BACT|nr:hypothetical protein ASNO1_01860 [Corallococcus sp. NO1]